MARHCHLNFFKLMIWLAQTFFVNNANKSVTQKRLVHYKHPKLQVLWCSAAPPFWPLMTPSFLLRKAVQAQVQLVVSHGLKPTRRASIKGIQYTVYSLVNPSLFWFLFRVIQSQNTNHAHYKNNSKFESMCLSSCSFVLSTVVS